jgi:hypothetical protein
LSWSKVFFSDAAAKIVNVPDSAAPEPAVPVAEPAVPAVPLDTAAEPTDPDELAGPEEVMDPDGPAAPVAEDPAAPADAEDPPDADWLVAGVLEPAPFPELLEQPASTSAAAAARAIAIRTGRRITSPSVLRR